MKKELAFIALLIVVLLVSVYVWMQIACSEKSEMDGYSISKTVATKCYGSNDGKTWKFVWL